MTHIQRLMAELEVAEDAANILDDLWDEDPENERLEEEWTKAYEKEHRTREAIIQWIVKFTKGAIDDKTARKMLYTKRDELKALIEKT